MTRLYLLCFKLLFSCEHVSLAPLTWEIPLVLDTWTLTSVNPNCLPFSNILCLFSFWSMDFLRATFVLMVSVLRSFLYRLVNWEVAAILIILDKNRNNRKKGDVVCFALFISLYVTQIDLDSSFLHFLWYMYKWQFQQWLFIICFMHLRG